MAKELTIKPTIESPADSYHAATACVVVVQAAEALDQKLEFKKI